MDNDKPIFKTEKYGSEGILAFWQKINKHMTESCDIPYS